MPPRRLNTIIGWSIVLVVVGSLAASLNLGGRGAAADTPLDAAKLARPDQVSGHVTVWSWNIAAKALKSLLPAFAERYPDVKIDVDMTGANLQARFLLSLSAGKGAPDISQLQAHESPRYIATGRMTDLSAVAMKYKDSFPPASWANCVHDGKVYAPSPWDIGPCAVFYKREIFARYGIDPEAIETWDDFIAAGKTILQKSGGRTKMLPLSPGGLITMYEMLLRQVEGQIFDADGRIAINSAASQRVMELMRTMLDSGICANVEAWSHEWMGGFNGDTIATYPGAVWLGGTIKDTAGDYAGRKATWGAFRLPSFDRGGLHTSNLGGSVLVIPDQCPQKEAAWLFIEYALCTREGQVAQYASFDLFPAYLPALDDPFFQQPDAFYDGQKVRAIFADAVRGMPVLYRTPDWVEANNYANQSFTRWAVSRGGTVPMLDALAQKLHRRLGREIAGEAQP